MPNEDQREAVKLSTTLSGQLMGAALSVMTLGGGFVGFVLANRAVGPLFFLVAGLTFLALILSTFLGAKGIQAAAVGGFNGQWTRDASRRWFSRQAVACILGLIFFVVTASLAGQPKTDETVNKISGLAVEVATLKRRIDEVTQSNRQLEAQLRMTADTLQRVSTELEVLRKTALPAVPTPGQARRDSSKP